MMANRVVVLVLEHTIFLQKTHQFLLVKLLPFDKVGSSWIHNKTTLNSKRLGMILLSPRASALQKVAKYSFEVCCSSMPPIP